MVMGVFAAEMQRGGDGLLGKHSIGFHLLGWRAMRRNVQQRVYSFAGEASNPFGLILLKSIEIYLSSQPRTPS